MDIELVDGKHSKDDKIILVTTQVQEPIMLRDLFHLIEEFAKNELRRIRVDRVREEIKQGKRPFLFQKAINKVIDNLK